MTVNSGQTYTSSFVEDPNLLLSSNLTIGGQTNISNFDGKINDI